jgi:hypothetical protein
MFRGVYPERSGWAANEIAEVAFTTYLCCPDKRAFKYGCIYTEGEENYPCAPEAASSQRKHAFCYSCTSSARSEIETFNTLAIFESVLMLTPEYGFVQILLMVVNDISVALEREDILYPLLIATSLTRNLIMYVYSSHSFDYPLYKRTHLD